MFQYRDNAFLMAEFMPPFVPIRMGQRGLARKGRYITPEHREAGMRMVECRETGGRDCPHQATWLLPGTGV